MDVKGTLTTWNTVTKTVSSTVAVVAMLVSGVLYFKPAAEASAEHTAMAATSAAQHVEIENHFDEEMSQHTSDQTRLALEAELQRIETSLKLYATIRERRQLTPDEQDEYEYLKARRLQIRERLFDK